MTQRKKLIEVALPLEAINEASAREKSIRHGHPSTLHLWWARRPLAAARAVIFSSLVDDPDSPDALPAFVEACKQLPKGKNAQVEDTPRQRLFDFIELLVQWESTTDEGVLNTARELIMIATEGNPPPLLDPFAGGGSIPLEAQRLGLEAHASDLNPVAVMINKAQIEIPPRFANMPPVNPRDRKMGDSKTGTAGKAQWKGAAGLAADVRYYGEWMREKAWEKIGHLYPTHNGETVIAWLWARTVKCPNPACGAEMPLITSFELSKKKGKRVWLIPHVNKEAKRIHFEVQKGEGNVPESPKAGRGARFKCLTCGEIPHEQYIKDEGVAGRMGSQLMAIVTEGKGGRSYYSPTIEQENLAKSTEPQWYPVGELAPDKRSMFTPLYGLREFRDLFTIRQLVALTTFSDLVSDTCEKIAEDALAAGLSQDIRALHDGGSGPKAYSEAISVYLGFLVNQLANHQSTICTWNAPNQQMRSTYARQALPMTWDYAESNPFCESSGSYHNMFERMLKSFDALPANILGVAVQGDAAQLTLDAETISTDPPYYDNIGYADLSDFFYVWMRKTLRNVYPDIFGTMLVPKGPELVASPYRHGSSEAANEHFENGMLKTFTNIQKSVSKQYPLTVYYAFKQQDAETIEEGEYDTENEIENKNVSQLTSTGWETMLTSLIDAGFSIEGTWPVRTEKQGRTVAIGTNALASSIVLVCRPRAEDAPNISRRAFVDALRRELPAALKEMQSGNIAPVDLAQASIGPGMAIYSRYSKVLEADGSSMSVRTALGLINQELDTYLAEQDGDIDSDTRFAVAWFTEYGFETGEYGRAETLATAKNVSVSGVERAGLVDSGKGKVKLRHWTEYDPGAWNPQEDKRATVWEATHHLIERLHHHGEKGSAMLMMQLPHDMAAEARSLAYRLYSICERKGWADHARDYNALVISWAEIGDVSAQLREAKASGEATEQKRLFED